MPKRRKSIVIKGGKFYFRYDVALQKVVETFDNLIAQMLGREAVYKCSGIDIISLSLVLIELKKQLKELNPDWVDKSPIATLNNPNDGGSSGG